MEEYDAVAASAGVKQRLDPEIIDYRENAWQINPGNATVRAAVQELKSYGVGAMTSTEAQEFFESNGFKTDPKYLGRMMKSAGYTYKQTRKGNFYVPPDID